MRRFRALSRQTRQRNNPFLVYDYTERKVQPLYAALYTAYKHWVWTS